jgi:hypothetical protein
MSNPEAPADLPAPADRPSPVDDRLRRALAAYEAGDFRAARALMPSEAPPEADDPHHHARLRHALRFEPWLAVMAAAGALLWLAAFIGAQ